jgi:hypothetical protein
VWTVTLPTAVVATTGGTWLEPGSTTLHNFVGVNGTAQLTVLSDTTQVANSTAPAPDNTFVSFGTAVSDGVAITALFHDVSDTPLPAALPLFATGLGALGLLGWRRKRKAVA